MCELLGISARRPLKANEILKRFFSHANEHPHGWGLALMPDGGPPAVEREATSAIASDSLRRRLEEPIEAANLVAHIRRATIGELSDVNTHPFTAVDNSGRTWLLAHNGTIFSGAKLNLYMGLQYGDTDSERILLYLVDRIDRDQLRLKRPLDAAERFAVVEDVVAELSYGNKLNLLVHDGEFLYVHVNYRDSLHYRRTDDAVVVSTRPLDGEEWTPVPFTRVLSLRDGEFVREGVSHEREYIFDPEDYRLVYMNFARL